METAFNLVRSADHYSGREGGEAFDLGVTDFIQRSVILGMASVIDDFLLTIDDL